MCKKTILSVCLFLLGNMAFAQGVLQVTDISQPNDVYSSAEDEAAVIIRCHESIPLKFSSTMDKSADPFQTELQGADSVYYIAFPTGNRYRETFFSCCSESRSSAQAAVVLPDHRPQCNS